MDKARSALTTLQQEQTERRHRFDRDIQEVDTQLAASQREMDALAVIVVAGLIADLDRCIVGMKKAISEADGLIEASIRQQSSLATDLGRLQTALSKSTALDGRVQALSDEIARSKLLAKGLGNVGVIALAIDDAGPAITAIVNDLLLGCYGPRFTIAIQTHEARESFSIAVLDADSNSSK